MACLLTGVTSYEYSKVHSLSWRNLCTSDENQPTSGDIKKENQVVDRVFRFLDA